MATSFFAIDYQGDEVPEAQELRSELQLSLLLLSTNQADGQRGGVQAANIHSFSLPVSFLMESKSGGSRGLGPYLPFSRQGQLQMAVPLPFRSLSHLRGTLPSLSEITMMALQGVEPVVGLPSQVCLGQARFCNSVIVGT